MSIRLKIASILVVAVVVPLAISSYISYNALKDSLGDKFGPTTLVHRGGLEAVVVERAADGMERRINTVTTVLTQTGKLLRRDFEDLDCLAMAARDRDPCRSAVTRFFAFHGEDVEGVAVSSSGRIVWSRLREEVGDGALGDVRPHVAETDRHSGEFVLRPVRVNDRWIFVSSRPLASAQRLVIWGTFAKLYGQLSDMTAGRVARPDLVDSSGTPLGVLKPQRRRGTRESRAVPPSAGTRESFDLAAWRRAGSPNPVEIDGQRHLIKYADVPGVEVGVVVRTSIDDFGQVRQAKALGVQILLMLVALIAAIVLTDRMMKRLRRLRDAADQIGAGNLGADIAVGGRDEIGRLAARFRVMAGQLREHIETLEQKVDVRTRDLRLKAEELARANEDLVRLTKLKSDFLARMSHELRTPLNSIIGFSELLLAEGCGPINEEQKDGLERVMRNGKNLLQLINDILDISKIEADRLTLKFGPAELRVIVDNALSGLMLRASDKKIALTAAVDPALPTLYTDEVRLLQILNNLLSNAVKFTEKGGVTLTADRAPEGVVIAVQDSGIGVAAEDVPKLFTEFYQTDSGRARKYEGTGLGLAITRRLAEALGGGVTVASELGVGSTFTVTLPIVAPGAEGEAAAAAATLAAETGRAAVRAIEGQPSILVIDDDPATHLLMAENLRPLGARFLSATTGAAGLETARAERPDLILLDVRLPDRQGWEVLHDLKADAGTQDIPVIVVSVVDRESLGFSLGAADYLVKPVNWDHLYKVLGRLGIAPAAGHVLIVDDDPEARGLLRRALESRGFSVREAGDGIQGLAAARHEHPGLIVLDLMMPVMDGFDALVHLRSDPKTNDVPVLVLTGKDLTEAERARLGGKVDALFQKQRVPLDQLVGEVRSLIWKGSHP